MICLETGLNCRHKDFQSFALPTELSKPLERFFFKTSLRISNNFLKTCVMVVFDKNFILYLTHMPCFLYDLHNKITR